VDIQSALAAAAEPTRFRILKLLAESPRTVGEVADAVGSLQPQTTKHLQALSAAGLIVVHRLGRRRVVALLREPFEELSQWFAELAVAHPSEAALDEYVAAIAVAERRTDSEDRTVHIRRSVGATPSAVWDAWTTASLVRQWWAPEHFAVVECTVEPVPGGAMDVSLGEPDGAIYRSTGRFLELDRPATLLFEQSPLGHDGHPMFTGTYAAGFAPSPRGTELDLRITLSDIQPGMSSVVAGVEIGWGQTLDRLAALLSSSQPGFG
jgi:uncharacterized protein YndB with AHSA1/START domain/DNA-binding MarR family transcriptional regulator